MSMLSEQDHTRAPEWNGGCPGCGAGTHAAEARGFRACAVCGTRWIAARRGYEYDDCYPRSRAHDDAATAACKVATLADWTRHLPISLSGLRVLEVGFGGGATLTWMRAQGAEAHGVEPVAANRAAACEAGIPVDRIAARIDDVGGGPFDLALYLDSFEHETEPDAHLTSLGRVIRSGGRAMLVLPVADCVSRRVMGRFWPHDLADHWVFYTTAGLVRLWDRHGWSLAATFNPRKYIGGLTIARHVRHKTGLSLPEAAMRPIALWLNFGERGLIFEKR